MRKKRLKKRNQGNSFIMVVATLSFLAVLATALLVAVALCYRLKAYDINARDNFYYLEQAMDEIYAGVGKDAMEILNQAYDDTLEVVVYYDTASHSYVTMDSDQANEIMKTTFMNELQKDSRYTNVTDAGDTDDHITKHLKSFLTYPYSDTNEDTKEGVLLKVGTVTTTTDNLTICNLVLERRAKYSTVNARSRKKAGDSGTAAADTFVQTLTTDLVIGKPNFNVNFDVNNSDLSDLYSYSMVADGGIEITGSDGKTAIGNKVDITGNIYAASDFYNKSYNEESGVVYTVPGATTTVTADQIQKINSYSSDRLKQCNGVNAKSMYSGLYVDGATLILASDRVIIPGSLAALNCADVTIYPIGKSSADYSDVWADGIVLDGYALRQNQKGDVLKGATLNMKARAYIYDDLEVNSNSGKVVLNGEYYGYNYASTDNRTYTKKSIENGSRKFISQTDAGITDGSGIDGQAHYNSSAIILNGENTELDFSNVKALYVAGQSYIEVSKNSTQSAKTDKITYSVKNGTAEEELTDEVKNKTYSYPTTVAENGKAKDNYSTDDNKKESVVQDYRTGEAISIKSNQLAYQPAYIPDRLIHDEDDGLYVKIPKRLQDVEAYKNVWSNLDKVPIIKTVISGKTKYFFDFSKADKKTQDVMNEFIEDYAALFDESTATAGGMTEGEALGLVDITDYDYFQVKMLKVSDSTTNPYANIYTNSAITTKVGDTFKIVASSKNSAPLVKAVKNINAAINEANNGEQTLSEVYSDVMATNVSSKLQNQYKEVKWLLTNKSSNGAYVTEAHNLHEKVITPINHYFDFSKITKSQYCELNSGYGVWISKGDVKLGKDAWTDETGKSNSYSKSFKNGKLRGIVIAKGDVTFDTNVNSFEGLIVSGGKVIINNFDNFDKTNKKTSMTFLANEEIVKTVLRECDNSRGNGSKNYGFVCDIFRLFKSEYNPPTPSGDVPVESLKSISSVQFEDILSFQNWKKNVD